MQLFLQKIDRWQWFILLVAAPLLMFPSPTRSIALIVVPLVWFIAQAANGKPILASHFSSPILLMALMVLVSLWATYDLTVSLPKVAGMMLAFGVFFAYSRFGRTVNGWRWCLACFLLCSFGVAALGFLGTNWFQGKIRLLDSLIQFLPSYQLIFAAASEGFHPNEIAGTLLWALPVLVVLSIAALRQTVKLNRWVAVLLYIITVFEFGVFVLTQSRTAYIALAAAVLMLAVYLPKKLRWALAACLLVAAIVVVLVFSGINQGFLSGLIFDQVSMDDPAFSINTLQGRVEIWSRALYAIRDFPLTGMGMNTFRYAVHVLYPLTSISPSFNLGHAHNEYLQAALDLGLPGLFALLWLYYAAYRTLFSLWKRPAVLQNSGWGDRLILLALAAALFAHSLYGITDAVSLGAKPGVLFWMLLGLIDSCGWQETHRSSEDCSVLAF